MAASPQDIQKLNERIIAIFTKFKEYEKKEFGAMLAENVSTALEGTNKVLEMTAKILEQEIKLLDSSSKSIKNKDKQIKEILIAQAVLSGLGPIAKMAKNYLSYEAARLKAKSDYTMEMINNNPELYNEVQEEITGFQSKDALTKIMENAKKAKDNAQQDNDKAAAIDTILIDQIDKKIAEDAVDAAKNANQEAQQAWNDVDKKNSAYNTEKDKQKRIDTLKEINKLSGVIRKKAAEVQKQARIAETAVNAQGYRDKSVEIADAIIKAFTTIQAVYKAHPNELKTLYAESENIKTLADAIKTESTTYITKDAYPKYNYAVEVAEDLSVKIKTTLNVVAFVKNLSVDERKALVNEALALGV